MVVISFVAGFVLGIAGFLAGMYVSRKTAPAQEVKQDSKPTDEERQWQRLMDYRGEEQGGMHETATD